MSEWVKGKREKAGRRMWITLPSTSRFVFSCARCRDVYKITCSYKVDWRWLRNWMQALSVACKGDYSAPPPLPPSHPLLHNTKRLRLTRTYQVISGQADLSLSSLLPVPFCWKRSSYYLSSLSPAPVFRLFMSFSVSFSLSSFTSPSLLHVSVFCPHREAW